MGPAHLAFLNVRVTAALFLLCVPLTVLWGYCLARSLAGALRAARDPSASLGVSPHATVPLDDLTWSLLLLLSGWFGALAYLGVVLWPRLRHYLSFIVRAPVHSGGGAAAS